MKRADGAARLIPFTAEGIGCVFPEQVVVRRRKILFVVTGVLPDPGSPAAGHAVHCVFVFCPVSGILLVFFFIHSEKLLSLPICYKVSAKTAEIFHLEGRTIKMNNKNTVIFDLDGTLLDTLEDLRDSVNVIMQKYGFPQYSLSQIRNFVGNGVGKLLERTVPGGRENESYESALADFKSYYTQHCRIRTKPYDGVLDLMKILCGRGFQLAIVSNKNDAAVRELNEIYFSRYTKAAIGDREGAKRKPAPDAVFAALGELGSKKEDAVYVGDSEVDYETAANSGLDCILVSWGFRDRELLQSLEGAVVADDCAELLKLLCPEVS